MVYLMSGVRLRILRLMVGPRKWDRARPDAGPYVAVIELRQLKGKIAELTKLVESLRNEKNEPPERV